MEDIWGNDISLEDLRGKYVLIEFWAIWCGPCMPEIPYLRDVYQKYGSRGDFAMIGVSLDEDINELVAFLEGNDMNWPQILDNDRESKWHGELGHSYAVGNGIPKSFLIDTDGVIIAKDLRKEDLLLEIGALFED